MALIFCDGFDKYGPANSNNAGVAALLTAGEWTSAAGSSSHGIVAGLSASGMALNMAVNASSITKTLAANYTRLIGGFRFSSTLFANTGIQFYDGASSQAGICFNTNGTIAVKNGVYTVGTILGTSTVTVTANSTHYLEWDITFGNVGTGAYQLWLDGVSILSGTGDTTATANAFANGIALAATNSGGCTFDDLYLFDSTGSTNNAVLLTSPRIETTFPVSDSAVQFAVGAAILGSNAARVTTSTPGWIANSLVLRRFVCPVACTLNSISGYPAMTNAGMNLRGVVYTESGGVAGALMSSGSTVVGVSSNVVVTLPLTTPQALVAGTAYWLGFMSDLAVSNWFQNDNLLAGYRATVTFSSGAPSTAPGMASGSPSMMVWGNLTGITGNNWYEAAQQPPPGLPSYLFDATVAHEDLYNFAALSAIPAAVYAVAVKAYVAKSDSGSRTVSIRTKSGATDSAGSLAGQAPGTSFGWLTSNFPTDPNTSAAWTGAALNAATSGLRVDS